MTELEEPRDEAARIREAIAEDLDSGRLPDPGELRRRFPGHDATVDRILRAVVDLRTIARTLADAPHATPHLDPGTRLGDFTILSSLAEGGMGRVYRARQESVGDRDVAVKVVSSGLGSAAAQVKRMARLRQEAAAAGQLHHPNLAEVYGCGEAAGVTYYAMLLVEGPTLEEVLRRLRGEPSAARRWRRSLVERVSEVASALAAVHRAGLVHGDVKPGNIVLQGGGTGAEVVPDHAAVLVDFGLAAAAGTASSSGDVAATVAYAAPEVLRGNAPDRRADVFSLGATLHDLLAARLPGARFEAAVGLEPLTGLVRDMDPDLAAVVAKAVDPQPDWRYQHAGELHADLVAWLRGDAVSARRPRLVQAARRLARQRPLVSALLGGTVLMVVLGLASATQQIGEGVASLHAAERATEQGDLVALGDELLSLQGTLVARWLMPVRMHALAEPLWSGADEPFTNFYTHQRAGEFFAACHAVAEHLIKNRETADRVFFDGLVFELRSGQPDRQAAAALATSRLFMHSPDLSLHATEQSRACREALLDLALDPSTDPDTRVDALAALAGCGMPAHVAPLLQHASRTEGGAEERRIIANSIGDILFRAQRCGLVTKEPGPPDFQDAAVRFVLAAMDPVIGPDGLGLGPMFLGWFTYLRDRGDMPVDLAPLAILHPTVLDEGTWDTVRAEAGDPSIRPALLAGPDSPDPLRIPNWGTDVRSFDDPAVTAAAREACRRLATDPSAQPNVISLFDAAYDKQDEDLRTRSVADVQESSPEGPAMPVEIATAPMTAPACKCAPMRAHWDLSGETVGLLGWAQGLTGTNVAFGAEAFGLSAEQTHWRLLPGGQAELTFWYEREAAAPERPLFLILNHQTASRNNMPDRGRADIVVEVDGKDVNIGQRVTAHAWKPDSFELHGSALRPGRHSLTVVLNPWSTTTYWIRCAGLVEGK